VAYRPIILTVDNCRHSNYVQRLVERRRFTKPRLLQLVPHAQYFVEQAVVCLTDTYVLWLNGMSYRKTI